jgi:hypothetical protein
MPPEERDDRLQEIGPTLNDVLTEALLVIVVPPVRVDPTYAEELLEFLEAAGTAHSLRHDEPWRDLIAGSVASPVSPIGLPHKRDGEASFSVYETDYPATKLGQPFLLIFRTRHIVTVDVASDATSSAGSTGFPAYSQMHTAPLPMRGATKCLEDLHSPRSHVTLGRL